MKIKSFKAVTRQLVPDAPEWVERLLEPINKQIKELTDILSKRASLADQIDCDVRTFEVIHNSPAELVLNVQSRVVGFTIIDSGNLRAQGSMNIIDSKKVTLTVNFATDPGKKMPVTVVFWGGN